MLKVFIPNATAEDEVELCERIFHLIKVHGMRITSTRACKEYVLRVTPSENGVIEVDTK